MELSNFISSPTVGRARPLPPPGNFDSAKIIDDAGFSSTAGATPFEATLSNIFGRFIAKTGITTTSGQLMDEFLESNPSVKAAVGLYNQLENTFAPRSDSEKSAIVGFLNDKIDEFRASRNTESPNSLTETEAGLPTRLFLQIDTNADSKINKFEIRNNFYKGFTPLENILDYFEGTPGVLVDTYG